MIYVPLPNGLLNKHKIIAKENSQLKKDLLKLQSIETDNISTPILEYIINNLERIVSCSLEELKIIQNEYLNLIFGLERYFNLNSVNYTVNEVLKFNNINMKIYDVFIKAYKNFTKRNNDSWNSYIFLKELDQNVCPYCNANFIHTVQSKQHLSSAASRGMADLDHFLPKSIFPIFSITLSNLVPSCIYCNQRFKSAYYTSFCRNLSPYDSKIKGKINFKITYAEQVHKNVFEKLEETTAITLPMKESYYIKLLSINHFEALKKFIDYSNESIAEIQTLLVELYDIRNQSEEHKESVKSIIRAGRIYTNELNNLTSFEIAELLEKKSQYILKLDKIYNFLKLKRQQYEEYKGKKTSQRKLITSLKDKIGNHLNKTKDIFDFNFGNKVNENNEINFVDVSLGKSLDYQIEINANCDLENDKYKVFNNAALFQIEAVYNEYRRHINRKIEQSNILNSLYKSQLQSQFPNLFQEYSFDSMSNIMLVDEESQRHEILGKLIYDLVVPNVKAQELMQLLKV